MTVPRFASYCQSFSPRRPTLPLVHSTDSFAFRSIITAGVLKVQRCEVFNEDLLYLFYGRPAYRVAQGKASRSDNVYMPVCLILKPELVQAPKRIYPFDTGAFDGGYFAPYLHEGMTRDDFLLEEPDVPPRMIEAFFGSNKAYYFGEAKAGLDFDIDHMEVKAYYDLISATGEQVHDDRRFTIEVQSTDGVALSSNILAVVCPTAFLQKKEFEETIVSAWKAVPLTYDIYKGSRPIEYHYLMRDRIKTFLETRSYL
jgi:hypothetical protein